MKKKIAYGVTGLILGCIFLFPIYIFWWSGPYGLRLLIFLQPLGRALKNQNAAPTAPPCFSRWLRSSSLLFKSSYPLLLLKRNCRIKQKRQLSKAVSLVVRVVIQHSLKTIVVQFVFEVIEQQLACIAPRWAAVLKKQLPFIYHTTQKLSSTRSVHFSHHREQMDAAFFVCNERRHP